MTRRATTPTPELYDRFDLLSNEIQRENAVLAYRYHHQGEITMEADVLINEGLLKLWQIILTYPERPDVEIVRIWRRSVRANIKDLLDAAFRLKRRPDEVTDLDMVGATGAVRTRPELRIALDELAATLKGLDKRVLEVLANPPADLVDRAARSCADGGCIKLSQRVIARYLKTSERQVRHAIRNIRAAAVNFV